jgi:hypothetical protein
MRYRVISVGVLLLFFFAGACEDKVVKQKPPPPPKTVSKADAPASNPSSRQAAKAGDGKQAQVEMAGITWVPRRNWERRVIEESRDPFYGFIDILIEEQLRQRALAAQAALEMEEVILPTQRFDVRDFKLVGLVTNTPTPKALLIDPENTAHVVNVGTLIGNRNGVVVAIKSDSIEIFQGEDLVNAPETVVMKLHPEVASGLLIQFQ